MNDLLYAKDLLRLAARATGAGRLAPCDAVGMGHNPVCGDRVNVTLRLDNQGRVLALGHETQACVLAQASAAILGAELAGADRRAVEVLRKSVTTMLRGGEIPAPPFTDYELLRATAAHRNRHTCVLLPIEAVLNAMRSKDASD